MDDPKTRAAVPAPPKRKSFLPETAALVGAADNMKSERLAPMTFNMPKSWHLEFKMEAAIQSISMKELLVDCFAAYNREKKRLNK
jgi:hypothetical protein